MGCGVSGLPLQTGFFQTAGGWPKGGAFGGVSGRHICPPFWNVIRMEPNRMLFFQAGRRSRRGVLLYYASKKTPQKRKSATSLKRKKLGCLVFFCFNRRLQPSGVASPFFETLPVFSFVPHLWRLISGRQRKKKKVSFLGSGRPDNGQLAGGGCRGGLLSRFSGFRQAIGTQSPIKFYFFFGKRRTGCWEVPARHFVSVLVGGDHNVFVTIGRFCNRKRAAICCGFNAVQLFESLGVNVCRDKQDKKNQNVFHVCVFDATKIRGIME